MTPIQAVYQSVSARSGVTYDEFVERTADYEFIPVIEDGIVIGGVMVRGCEVHVGVVKTPSGAMRGMLRRILNEIHAKHSFVFTAVMIENSAGIRFCKRLGFTEAQRDELAIYYRKDRPC